MENFNGSLGIRRKNREKLMEKRLQPKSIRNNNEIINSLHWNNQTQLFIFSFRLKLLLLCICFKLTSCQKQFIYYPSANCISTNLLKNNVLINKNKQIHIQRAHKYTINLQRKKNRRKKGE